MSAGEFYQMFAGLGGGFMKGYEFGNKISDRRRAQEQEATLAQMLAGMTGGASSVQTQASSVQPASQSRLAGGNPAFREAISSIESGGRYGITGPVTKSGDRAYGKYQVMGANIPSWTREALGQEMTPAQFLASPEAQDAVFDHRFGGYVQKYGNPQDAASAWFTGRPLAQGRNSTDVLGTSGQGYVDKFTAALGRSAPPAQAIEQSVGQSQQGVPQQVAQAPQPTATDAMAMVRRAPGVDPRLLMGILNNPQSGAGAKAIAQTLLAKQFETKDPMAQLKMALEIQKMQSEMNRPNTEIIRDAATGEILSVDRNNPAAGVTTLRKAGLSKDAPTTRQIKQPDGSEVVVQWNPENRRWEPMPAPEGGAAVRAPNKLTEQQSKDIVYYNRGRQALETLGDGSALAGGADAALSRIPGVGNYLVSEPFQLAKQSGTNFLLAVLRKDTGAAVTASEEKMYGEVFLPRPGDGPAMLAQKAQARAQALDAIRDGLGPAEVLAIGKRFTQRDADTASPPAQQKAPSRLPAGKTTTINGVKIERIE